MNSNNYQRMNNRFSSNGNESSIFSLEYKIPYGKDPIESQLQESQEEIGFIKVKLTQAYQKLQFEIEANNRLQEEVEGLEGRVRELEEKYAYERKENSKLKETLQVILKNRKLMQEEAEEVRESVNRKVGEKEKVIEQLRKEIKGLVAKCGTMSGQLQQRERVLKEYSVRMREQSLEKEAQSQREIALANKIHILEQEIARITQQKYVEVNRLRHELQLYQRSTSPMVREIRYEQEGKKEERKREFARPTPKKAVQIQKFSTKGTEETEFQSNKENLNSLQINPNNSIAESSICKWKKHETVKDQVQNETVIGASMPATDDQQLTEYQIMRKKAEQELCGLQKIKRPSNQEREKIVRLQREIYHLDSDIAGLKRKIRRKY